MDRAFPQFVMPMKAQLADELPKGREWMYEVKLDGYRAIAVKDRNQVRLFSRKPRDITEDFSEVAAALKKLRTKEFVLDGEIVALDSEGRSSFQALQNFRRD